VLNSKLPSLESASKTAAELCSAWTGVGARPHTSKSGKEIYRSGGNILEALWL
jgi:hypothetical protein